MLHITESQFIDRFVTLVMRGNGLPKKAADRHILLLSATLSLDPKRQYSEKDLNLSLRGWSDRFGDSVCMDHATLRRFLVDEKYISRDAAGSTYTLRADSLPVTFDQPIKSLNLQALIDHAERTREERKRSHSTGMTHP